MWTIMRNGAHEGQGACDLRRVKDSMGDRERPGKARLLVRALLKLDRPAFRTA